MSIVVDTQNGVV